MYVLDASAILAYLNEEPGGDQVEPLLDDALLLTVNLAEVLQRGAAQDIDPIELTEEISRMGIHTVPFDAAMAATSASIWAATRARGLSLGDRACLALCAQVNGVAVTTDQAWAHVSIPGVDVHVIGR